MPIPNPEEEWTPREQFEPGSYKVRFDSFTTVNEDQDPIFTPQSGQKLVVRYRTILSSGDEGPPGSVEKGQIPIFVKALGGDVSALPPYNQPNKRLIIAERLVKEANETVKVTVGDTGWITRIPGMEIPPGYYELVCRGIVSKGILGEPSWKDGQYGKYFVPCVEILSDSGGRPTPWDHVKVYESVPYALEEEDGELVWETRDDGRMTSNSFRHRDFFRAVCPSVFKLDLEVFEDLNNILPEANRIIKDLSIRCTGHADRSVRSPTRRVILRLAELQAVSSESLVVSEEGAVELSTTEKTTPADPLYDVLNAQFDGKAFFAGDGNELTDEAKAWWRAFKGVDPTDGEEVVGIVAFAKKHRIPGKFAEMSDEQVKLILGWMGKGKDDF